MPATAPNVFFIGASPKFVAQAVRKAKNIGRKPLRLVPQCRKLAKSALEPGGLDISTGVITAQYVKDPTDPQWDNDPEINSWRALMDK